MPCNSSSPDASPGLRFKQVPNRNAMQKPLTFMLLLLLTAFLLCSPATAADRSPATAPALTIGPAFGPPTTQVRVSGVGFDPYAIVDIYFDAAHQTQVTTNGAGAFGGGSFQGGIAVRVPASALPGSHWFMAMEHSGQKMARKQFLVRTDWAQFHFGPEHAGLNPYENVLSPANVGGLQLAWSYPTGGGIPSPPALANGILYVVSQDFYLYALDATTGSLLWKYTLGAVVDSSPAVVNGVVYVGSSDGMYALDATTGALLWTFRLGAGQTPTVANGVVYFGCGVSVCAVNAATGALLWQSTYTGESVFAVAVGENQVVFGSVDPITRQGLVYALDAGTGNLLWSTFVANSQNGDVIFSTPAFNAPYVYVNTMIALGQIEYGALYCLGMARGGICWSGPTGGMGASPAVANGMVYDGISKLYTFPGHLYAYTMDGLMMWQYVTNANVGSPAVANGVVYFGAGSTLCALNAGTGAPLWQYPVNASSPVIANGVVYVGSGDGKVYAFNLTGGSSSGNILTVRAVFQGPSVP